MLFELIFTVFDVVIKFLINLLPDFSWIVIPEGISSAASSLFNGIGYLLPMKGLMPIIFYSFFISSGRLLWFLILRIKSFIPTMGR